MMSNNDVILSIEDLQVSFGTDAGKIFAVDGVSYDVKKGRTLAVVGESGCGKSVTALSILRLIPRPPGQIERGRIVYKGTDLISASEKRMRTIRGNHIAMIFQEPMTSLNPVYTIGSQIVEVIEQHQKLDEEQAWQRAVDMLDQVGISDPERRAMEYPHQLSGGMRQRAMIAMALSCDPSVLIADEPTTALDVTIQAQILELLRRLQQEREMSVILITHDLGVVAENADDVVVMYASKIVEKATVNELFEKPLHPYTQGLLGSLPVLGSRKDRLETIGGSVPDPSSFPSGCKFHPRCKFGREDKRCRSKEPELREVCPGRWAACWYVEGYETEAEKQQHGV